MWTLIEFIVLTAIIFVLVVEFFIPLLTNKPLFGSFRKKKVIKKHSPVALDKKINIAKEKVHEVKKVIKTVQDEASENFNSAEKLKDESDNLLL
jgi:hypothetical protein